MSWKDIIKAPINRDEARKIHRDRIKRIIDEVDKEIRQFLKSDSFSSETTAYIEKRDNFGRDELWVTSDGGMVDISVKGEDIDLVMKTLYRVWKDESDADVIYNGKYITIKFEEDIEYKD